MIATKNRIKALFEQGDKEVLSIYFTAGYPNLGDTVTVLKSLAAAGVDMVEIGIPFSDPMADGPTIQQSGQRALENGMTLSLLFEQLENIREEVKIPLVLMGYLNVVYQYGIELFCKKCSELGIDGVILPDLPMDLYEEAYKATFERYGLSFIQLITPQSSEERIRKIDALSDGFIYMVSSAATTGGAGQFSEAQEAYFERVRGMNLSKPTVIGFGIADHESFQAACAHARGAIIGSAFIRAIRGVDTEELAECIHQFVQKIRFGN